MGVAIAVLSNLVVAGVAFAAVARSGARLPAWERRGATVAVVAGPVAHCLTGVNRLWPARWLPFSGVLFLASRMPLAAGLVAADMRWCASGSGPAA
jgi:Mn2+/Fe2+ NRAMP family transporter